MGRESSIDTGKKGRLEKYFPAFLFFVHPAFEIVCARYYIYSVRFRQGSGGAAVGGTAACGKSCKYRREALKVCSA